jgi:hypothetical protein
MSKNIAASVRARLKNYADKAGEPLQLTLTRYGLERLLYRLSVSPYADQFLLKGALLFTLWYDVPHRPTRDADLLGFGPDDIKTAENTFREICTVKVDDDGLRFDAQSVKGTEIRKGAGYNGVAIEFDAYLEKATIKIRIDIGFGDAVTPAPETVDFPTYLDDQPAPRLRAYPKYTVVAEKFEAICKLGIDNSRMKDYFDLYYLLVEDSLENKLLRSALDATLERRKTPRPVGLPVGLSDEFIADKNKQSQWTAFIKRNSLDALTLDQVVKEVRSRLALTGIFGAGAVAG